MNAITLHEYNELREKILEMAREALSECDYYYLHDKGFMFAFYYVLESLSKDLDRMKQEFYERHDREKAHFDSTDSKE